MTPYQMSPEDATLYEAAARLREMADVVDVPPDERARASARNEREGRVARHFKAYGLRWAADAIDPTMEDNRR